ncbi:PAH2 domain-containing protein [Macrolepiota fuliginosa MF-IS2]|uniref:PAH2 domain-containing protein n=1 Tax=Macrolepiota fuliginosa MF-IS2 TaxID=1400762 RepID=A0A9P5X6G0_9AGAR|nr:PAH2 domain-containing protein [Macrolepiota fuliginosa MF-IS2]
MNSPPTCARSDPIKRAYEYLNQVRTQFMNNREVYDSFVEVMGRFKEQSLERMEVIERVAELFAGHHQLLSGFNQFLPKGYRLEPSNDPTQSYDVVIVTPEGRRETRGQTSPSAVVVGP